MKTSLSLLAAVSATVVIVPMAFADASSSASSMSSSSASSVMSSSSSSSSSMMSVAPCMDKTGAQRIICMNAMHRQASSMPMLNNRNSRIQMVVGACDNRQNGDSKLMCLHNETKAVLQKSTSSSSVDSAQNAIPLPCKGMRGKGLGLCIQSLAKHTMHSMNKMMSSSSTSAASSAQ